MTEGGPIRLGELLIKAQILTPEQLQQAIKVAGETGLPIGRVLIMSGAMTDLELQSAIQAQSLIKDKVLSEDMALQALKIVAEKEIVLEHALQHLGLASKKTVTTAKLGELLLAAELVDGDKLEEALRTSQETGLPLGRILVLTQLVSDELLSAALTAQVLIRDAKISKEQAVEGLKSARRRRVSLEQSLMEQGFYRPPSRPSVKLGDLLMLAQLISDSELMAALELSLVRSQPIGQALVDTGKISPDVLEAALRFQEMVSNDTLSPTEAANALKMVAESGMSVSEALSHLRPAPAIEPPEGVRITDILKAAGFMTDNDIKGVPELESTDQNTVLNGLLARGMVSQDLLFACLRCQYLIMRGFLNMEHAIVALNHCEKNNVHFDEALEQLGWVRPTRMHL